MKQIKRLFARSTARHYLALITALLTLGTSTLTAQDHVLPLSELHRQVANTTASQQADQAAIQSFFAGQRVRDTLRKAGMDSEGMARSAALLDTGEQAELASRIRAANDQMAGGELKDSQVTLIIMCVAAFAILTVFILAFK
jgi:hypothetical protein